MERALGACEETSMHSRSPLDASRPSRRCSFALILTTSAAFAGCFRVSTPIRPDVAVDDATDASAIDDRSAIDASNDRSVVMLDGAAQDSAPDASTTSADADAARDAVVDVATDVAADVATDAASARCGDAATCGVGQFCSGGACVQEATLHGGAEHMCLRVRDSYTCWGMSSNGATGNPVDVRVATPPAAHGAGASGAVFAMANYTYSTEFIFGADRAVGFLGARHAFGDNSNASGNRGPELVRIANTEGMLELANPGPGGVRCGITMDHRVRCWGCNRNGALGVGDMIATDCAASPSAPNAVTLPLTNVAQVAIARSFEHDAFRSGTVCARFESGAVRCWGINDVGQRGIGTTSLVNDLSPTAATAPDIAGHTFSWITSAESSFCGVAEGGTVYCWGEGSAYRGFGFEGAVPTPTTITNPATMAPLTNMRVVQCGVFNCCAIERGTNELFCWGTQDVSGVRPRIDPNGPLTQSIAPTRIRPPGIAPGTIEDVGIGDSICVIARDEATPARRRVVCWGENENSQCGATASPVAGFTVVNVSAPGF